MFNGRLVKRKWGWYWTILDRKHFKMKLLRFKKDGALSMQYHRFRDELWLFLSGTGKFILNPHERRSDDPSGEFRAYGDSVIKVGTYALHQYIAEIPSWIIEVQYGERCVEEDIVRV